jgi:hypothetical protein
MRHKKLRGFARQPQAYQHCVETEYFASLNVAHAVFEENL